MVTQVFRPESAPRRWPQLTIGSLMGAILVAGIVLGIVAAAGREGGATGVILVVLLAPLVASLLLATAMIILRLAAAFASEACQGGIRRLRARMEASLFVVNFALVLEVVVMLGFAALVLAFPAVFR